MELLINQKKEVVPEGCDVSSLMLHLGFETFDGLAVAINDEVIPKNQWDGRAVSQGDTIAILQAVQGG